ncbi:DUF1661 domain-containing protein [Porphyromonas gingivalis]|nr:DUF1661 domain-containing protein [Porphyromonas gingivalis]
MLLAREVKFSRARTKKILRHLIIGKTRRDEKKNETGYFVCGTSQNDTG